MESEENLSLKKQNSEKNISVENSSTDFLPHKTSIEEKPKSPINKNPEPNQAITNSYTRDLINLALEDLQLSREELKKN